MKLLFLHGAGSAGAGWAHQVEYFAGSEAVTLPGRPEGELCQSLEEYVEWLRGYIQRQRYQDVVLAGHSMGGGIAQLYGLRYGKDLKALVLAGTGARLRVLPARLAAVREMVADDEAWRKYLEGEYSHIELEMRNLLVEEGVRVKPAAALNDYLCCDKFDIMDRVHLIRLPTLVICGSNDDRTPLKYSTFLADKIEGATQVIIGGGSHWAHMDKPAEFNQAVESFLTRLG